MNIQIKEITGQSLWTSFFNENNSPSFLQSWQWGEFNKEVGYDTLRLGIFNRGELTAIALVIKIRSKRGSFLFIPHGPIINIKYETSDVKHILKELRKHLINIAKKENFSFIRVSPVLDNNEANRDIYKVLGFKKAPLYMHAEKMWILALKQSEDELLCQMRKTTRYLVKKAQRDQVEIVRRTDEKAVQDFYKIYKETTKREKFVGFSKKYIRAEFESFNKEGNAIFLFAKIKFEARNPKSETNPNLNLATALILFTKSTAFYHQGASIHSKIPAAYLLQWEAIKEAKKRGCEFYNFWGILDQGRSPKTWAGLTLFKQGFGGYEKTYVATQDYVINPLKYLFTNLAEQLLKKKRGV